jgi:hypothetical protein
VTLAFLALALALAVQDVPAQKPACEARPGEAAESQLRYCEEITVVATPEREPAPLTSVTLSASDLRALGPDSGRWLAFAKLNAGVFVGRDRVYVDGLPADGMPDSTLVDRIAINLSAFAAEYGGVDQNRIEITTRAPARRWGFDFSPATWSRQLRDPLTRERSPEPGYQSLSIRGPVPHSPVSLFVRGSRYDAVTRPTFIAAESGALALETAADSRSALSDVSMGGIVATPRVLVRVSIGGSSQRLENAGTSGGTAPSAASQISSDSYHLQATWRTEGARAHRGGMVVRRFSLASVASSSAQGTIVAGQFIGGGNAVQREDQRQAGWFLKHVVRSSPSADSWTVGAELGRTVLDVSRVFNSSGVLTFDREGASIGTWMLQRGPARNIVTADSLAAFAERPIVLRGAFSLRAGVRGDWQRDDGVFLSPRVSSALTHHGFVVAAGAGLFVDSWPAALLLETAMRGAGSETWLASHVAAGTSEDMPGAERLILARASTFGRRHDGVMRASLQRRVGAMGVGVEHAWTVGVALPGLTRGRSQVGLVDRLDSDRRLRRHQTHVRVDLMAQRASVTAHYELVDSQDDSDGPFALPAVQRDVDGEWARSTGIARHNVAIVASATLPGEVHISGGVRAASGLPYSVMTGRDTEGLSTFTDRAGRSRNDASLPGTESVHAYASKRVGWRRLGGLAVDLGIRGENLLDSTEVLDVVRVADSPWLGRPITARGGRTASFWLTLSR